jgi:hypothetical protein
MHAITFQPNGQPEVDKDLMKACKVLITNGADLEAKDHSGAKNNPSSLTNKLECLSLGSLKLVFASKAFQSHQ